MSIQTKISVTIIALAVLATFGVAFSAVSWEEVNTNEISIRERRELENRFGERCSTNALLDDYFDETNQPDVYDCPEAEARYETQVDVNPVPFIAVAAITVTALAIVGIWGKSTKMTRSRNSESRPEQLSATPESSSMASQVQPGVSEKDLQSPRSEHLGTASTSRASQPLGNTSAAPVIHESPDQPTDRTEIVESLRDLKALHDDGILTDDEYESKRRRLTDRL